MLKQRVLTAIIGLPIILSLLIHLHGFGALILFGVFVALSAFEMGAMLLHRFIPDASPVQYRRLLAITVFVVLVLYALPRLLWFDNPSGLFTPILFLAMLLGLLPIGTVETRFSFVAALILTVVYAVIPWSMLLSLHDRAPASAYTLLVLSIAWGNDTGGFFGGRFFGKHRLAPMLSPKKTWEGAISGIIVGVLFAQMLNSFYAQALGSWQRVAVMSVTAGVLGQLGDLLESLVKRAAAVKDSGRIFPGHGGFLDRVDSLLYTTIGVWLCLMWN